MFANESRSVKDIARLINHLNLSTELIQDPDGNRSTRVCSCVVHLITVLDRKKCGFASKHSWHCVNVHEGGHWDFNGAKPLARNGSGQSFIFGDRWDRPQHNLYKSLLVASFDILSGTGRGLPYTVGVVGESDMSKLSGLLFVAVQGRFLTSTQSWTVLISNKIDFSADRLACGGLTRHSTFRVT